MRPKPHRFILTLPPASRQRFPPGISRNTRNPANAEAGPAAPRACCPYAPRPLERVPSPSRAVTEERRDRLPHRGGSNNRGGPNRTSGPPPSPGPAVRSSSSPTFSVLRAASAASSARGKTCHSKSERQVFHAFLPFLGLGRFRDQFQVFDILTSSITVSTSTSRRRSCSVMAAGT